MQLDSLQILVRIKFLFERKQGQTSVRSHFKLSPKCSAISLCVCTSALPGPGSESSNSGASQQKSSAVGATSQSSASGVGSSVGSAGTRSTHTRPSPPQPPPQPRLQPQPPARPAGSPFSRPVQPGSTGSAQDKPQTQGKTRTQENFGDSAPPQPRPQPLPTGSQGNKFWEKHRLALSQHSLMISVLLEKTSCCLWRTWIQTDVSAAVVCYVAFSSLGTSSALLAYGVGYSCVVFHYKIAPMMVPPPHPPHWSERVRLLGLALSDQSVFCSVSHRLLLPA